jgi:hypothetical protein
MVRDFVKAAGGMRSKLAADLTAATFSMPMRVSPVPSSGTSTNPTFPIDMIIDKTEKEKF